MNYSEFRDVALDLDGFSIDEGQVNAWRVAVFTGFGVVPEAYSNFEEYIKAERYPSLTLEMLQTFAKGRVCALFDGGFCRERFNLLRQGREVLGKIAIVADALTIDFLRAQEKEHIDAIMEA